jgi:hypothetical protein
MSCDYSVWNSKKHFTAKEAGEVHGRLCENDLSDVEPSPSIAAFYQELTAKHPEIDDVPEEKMGDNDYSPWSCSLDKSDGHVIMPCVWVKADYVGDLVRTLAKKHGLVFYDPQSERILYPHSETSQAKQKPWWKIW